MTIGIEPELHPAVERLLAASRPRAARPLIGRELWTQAIVAVAFVAAATALALGVDAERSWSVPTAVILTLAYAVVSRVQFDDGTGFTAPTQLVFVPMLLLLPTPAVPLLVAVALVLSRLPSYLSRAAHPSRAVLAVGDAWYSVGPALVLAASGAQQADWGHWPIYLAALGAQFAFDLGATTAREWLALGVSPRLQVRLLSWVYLVDALLAPIGLLAVFATEGQPYGFTLILPLIGLMAMFARERHARLDQALELSRAYLGTAMVLGDVVEADDHYTGRHSRGVVALSLEVADELGLDERVRRNVEFGALLHDVGKIAVPKDIINKPGPLTLEELVVVRLHTVDGQRMLDQIGGMLAEVGRIVRASHERIDGCGYPDGLGGEEIPVESRIIGACDAFHAMVTDRPYRHRMSTVDALIELRAHSGTQFDADVVGALCTVVSRRAVGSSEPASTPAAAPATALADPACAAVAS